MRNVPRSEYMSNNQVVSGAIAKVPIPIPQKAIPVAINRARLLSK